MSRKLAEVDFLEILPLSIAHDESVRAAVRALDIELRSVLASSRNILLWARIDELDEAMLAHLAARLHVDVWDPDWSLERKRMAVRNAVQVHRYKGTTQAVRLALAPFAAVRMEEWFEYGGAPYTFRVLVDTQVGSEALYQDIRKAVNQVKNVRSHFEAIRLPRESTGKAGMVGILHAGYRLTLS
ncbi:phage tail protein I [Desulfocurvibacter africanus]|uniref:Phage tail protein I n=1 Tax=Desulfocurvibacter africanus subsp. africanus str. Walvis Bay TaxID=690850 RepID=F3YY60_DESAF|nr:phage tail protein I [Desulfocurvibacter africanus]EGJ51836.1 phage tail protein I [Desulfocurvibacter africanus subsp. africanus str. Walvis Bay]